MHMPYAEAEAEADQNPQCKPYACIIPLRIHQYKVPEDVKI